MSNYYLTLVFIVITSMIVSMVHFSENQTLSRRVRRQLIFISSFIILGVVCEGLGICLDLWALPETRGIHGLIKGIEFTVTPAIPVLYINIINKKKLTSNPKIFALCVLIFNAFLESTNIVLPLVFYIDENSLYKHGNFYALYIIVYSIEIAIFIFELLRYSKRYQIRNLRTLISILIFLLAGLSIRITDNSIKTDWLIVAITYLLFIIYYSDLSLKVDPLTGLLNRKSYENRLKKLDYTTAIIMMDINNFKQINDELGHAAGDKILKIISRLILKSYSKYGYCYRIGGDEFCVILKPHILEDLEDKKESHSDMLDSLNKKFDDMLLSKCDEYPSLKNGISKGYSVFYGENNQNFTYDDNSGYVSAVQEAINIADKKLYEDKKNK